MDMAEPVRQITWADPPAHLDLPATPNPADSPNLQPSLAVAARITAELHEFLSQQDSQMRAIADDLAALSSAVTDFVATGGKRLRPLFCYWGWRGANGADCPEIIRAAAVLELLHMCALIHDDIMDESDIRRGKPAVHRRLADLHRDSGWRGSSEKFGNSTAILVGNFCLVWTDDLLYRSGLSPQAIARAMPIYHVMRSELMGGQYLDLLEPALDRYSVPHSLRVTRYKSAHYTVERPLLIGGELAGANPELLTGYTKYGLAIGDAFQLRDDILGVFGDPVETGKAANDLQAGKHTVLLALTHERATPIQRKLLGRLLHKDYLDDAEVSAIRDVIVTTGALERSEQLISEGLNDALAVLHELSIPQEVRSNLAALAVAATTRTV